MKSKWWPETGAVLGDQYLVQGELGRGPTGVVYQVMDPKNGQSFVAKVFDPEFFQGHLRSPNLLRLRRAALHRHANVLPTHRVQATDSYTYVVSDYAVGSPLDRWINEGWSGEPETLCRIFGGLIEGLRTIHSIAVHGNLKPTNVWVRDGGEVLLLDPYFLLDAERKADSSSAEWLAPEQRGAGWPECYETDVHGCALLVGFCLAGRCVAAGKSLLEQGLSVSSALDEVFLRATRPQPEARYQELTLFWSELEAALRAPDSAGMEPSAASVAVEVEVSDLIQEGDDATDSDDPEAVAAIDVDETSDEKVDDGGDEKLIAEEVIAEVLADDGEQLGGSDVIAHSVMEEDIEEATAVAGESRASATDSPEVSAPSDSGVLDVADNDVLVMGEHEILNLEESVGGDASMVEAVVENRPPPVQQKLKKVADPRIPTVEESPRAGSSVAQKAALLAESRHREQEVLMASTHQSDKPPKVGPIGSKKDGLPALLVYGAPLLLLSSVVVAFMFLNALRQESPGERRALEITRAELTMNREGVGKAVVSSPQEEAQRVEPADAALEPKDVLVTHAISKGSVGPVEPAAASFPIVSADVVEKASGPKESLEPDAGGVGQGERQPDSAGDESEADGHDEVKAAIPELVPAIDPTRYRCPAGMAKVRRRGEKKGKEVQTGQESSFSCIDKHEFPGRGMRPKIHVTLTQAKAACRSRGKRLCSRTEWRRACGAKYPYPGDFRPGVCNTIGDNLEPQPILPSGTMSACRGRWGTVDMVGNVSEWTANGTVNGGSSIKGRETASCYSSSKRQGGAAYVGFRCCAEAKIKEAKTEGDAQ